jgi:pyruvate,orthophosphate dikinase
MREMILAQDDAQRTRALDKLLPMQRADFKGIFQVMDGLPVTIRLLDPPLHEFLPQEDKDLQAVADQLGVTIEALRYKANQLHEFNPMLGHRGCRLAISYPGVARMQTRAIIEGALIAQAEGTKPIVEIMVPLIAHEKELQLLRADIEDEANKVFAEKGTTIEFLIGTMIELPRAALTADEIAQHAQFFSFGTNDLTQTTFGLSRDDSNSFLPSYVEKGILACDPFVSLDQSGVGQLLQIATEKGRAVKPDIKIGICGEHGGDPQSVTFCHALGMDYVSCSPFRIPIARLAAAQASINDKT